MLAATAGVNRTVLLRGNMAKTEKSATSGKMKAVLSGNSTAANISPDRRMSAARLLRGKAAAPPAAKSKNYPDGRLVTGTTDPFVFQEEYYGNLVTCAGNTFLLTRVQTAPSADLYKNELDWERWGWRTRVRMLHEDVSIMKEPTAILEYYMLSADEVPEIIITGS